ncbi:FAD-dependent pyridine nucleotide-disulfide oxidoreductase [Hyphomicrobium sp. GJ21]|uniref:apoptosis inducing factor family protein n=1 Tax=Hyphomicrobium sp. GJ21 TaxID=113574 RepID=UPI000622B98F|nr:apoptosis inducing factor family protein [Hyphomicrobium sp. GJ21]CEJ87444.1 FAD-dependent pyridine nucleotide-disulfide oxidoreductase [Hyphomicrobium sp. GJ21]
MSSNEQQLSGPDFARGVPASDIVDGKMLLGHFDGEAVLLAKTGAEIFAVGATCTHYNGPLAEGLLVGDTVRCPWHHACFSLRTGEALRAPALNPVSCFRIEESGETVFVREKIEKSPKQQVKPDSHVRSVVIVGGGAAGNAGAEMLRRQEFKGTVTILSADDALPYDRPNLSKDYLAGNASEDWIPLRTPDFYNEQKIDVRLKTRVVAIDTVEREVTLADGSHVAFDALLLATGAAPVRLDIPGAGLPHVHYLRTLDDSRALFAKTKDAKRAVVIGASFIGLETAASLRARDIEVHVVGPQSRPLERVLGAELGDMIRAIHEERGVVFHFGTTAVAIDEDMVTLKSGDRIPADLVVAGIGVQPDTALAKAAGLTIDNGVVVDQYLQTSVPGVYAAGDIARWPDPHSGAPIRVEHWVVAERQGQTAAINMLGGRQPFDAAPFFWSQHFDVTVSYVGHAEKWDKIEIDGDPSSRDCKVTYLKSGRTLAVATVSRDLESLRAEVELESS